MIGAGSMLTGLPLLLLAVGLGATLVTAVAGLWLPQAALAAWLAAAVTVTMVPFGALPFVLCWRLHRGAWGPVLSRALHAAVATIPLAGILMLPVLVGAAAVFPWAGQETAHGVGWLTAGGVFWRGLLYLAIWTVLGFVASDSIPSDGTDRSGLHSGVVCAGLALYALVASFAGFDWVLGIQAEVYSSIFGLVMIAHQMTGALAFVVAVVWLGSTPSDSEGVGGIGNMLLGAVMLWGYLAFMQYLIVWSGDLPEHTAFYLARVGGFWTVALWTIALGHGVIPFVLLLMRRVRANPRPLAAVAVLILAMRVLEGLWLVVPAFPEDARPAGWLTLSALFGAGGLWGGAFLLAWRGARLRIGRRAAHG